MQNHRPQRGTGLALENFTTGLPLVGDVQVTEVVITGLSTFAGGLQASGTVTGIVRATGLEVSDEFTTDVLISSSGPGNCGVVTVELDPAGVDVLGVANVEIPVANLDVQGSGAVGSLLCAVGGIANGAGQVVGGLVNALNALIGAGQTPRPPVPPRGPRA